ncbi:MAG: UMP kinase, partial [Clostridia bacterium]|nr:UMP kinase [Clostridia bacterium]
NPDAKKYDTLTHLDVLKQGLHVMDSTAASLCMDNGIEILVFNLDNPDNIVSAMVGETIGTVVK